MVKGPIFNVDSNTTKTETIYTYRKHEEADRKAAWYECVSDHDILTLNVDLNVSRIHV